MKLELKHDIIEDGVILEVTEVYSGFAIKTAAGSFGICQRDAGIELHLDDGPWYSWQNQGGPVKLGPRTHVQIPIGDLQVIATFVCEHGKNDSCDNRPDRGCCQSCHARRLARKLLDGRKIEDAPWDP